MIWPSTIRFRPSVPPAQPASCAVVKHGAEPHGPFAPIASASVFRLVLSVSLISTSRIEVSSS